MSADSKISQESLEQIVHAYSDATPNIRYRSVPIQDGNVGLIEIFREPQDIPYRVNRNLGGGVHGIKQGDAYVRHGSHTEPSTPREQEDLEAEDKTTRAEC